MAKEKGKSSFFSHYYALKQVLIFKKNAVNLH